MRLETGRGGRFGVRVPTANDLISSRFFPASKKFDIGEQHFNRRMALAPECPYP